MNARTKNDFHRPSVPVPTVPRARPLLVLIALVLLVAAGKSILGNSVDPDFFWHLRVAEQLERDGIGPIVDSISFNSVRDPWTPYSWLAEIGMLCVWRTLGVFGVVFGEAVLAVLLVGFGALACREAVRMKHATGGELNILLGTIVIAMFSLAFVSFRPASMALVMLAATALFLLRDQRLGRTKLIWLIVPLTVLLANIHLYVVVALMWLAAICLGEWISKSNRARRTTWLAVASTAAACCTPMLPGVIEQVLNYNGGDVMVASGFIREMQPFYAVDLGWLMLGVFLVSMFFVIRNRREVGLANLFWFVASSVLLWRLGRFAPVWAISAVPVVLISLPAWNGVVIRRPIVSRIALAVLLIGVIRLGMALPRVDSDLNQWMIERPDEQGGYPVRATAFVEREALMPRGRVINEFNWGGYLAWRFGERAKVFMDGRTQLYSSDFWRETCLGEPDAARPILMQAQAEVAILPVRKSRFESVLKSIGWREVYRDDLAVVLVPGEVTAVADVSSSARGDHRE